MTVKVLSVCFSAFSAGYNYFGTERTYSGVDGREFEADIFFGVRQVPGMKLCRCTWLEKDKLGVGLCTYSKVDS